MANRSSGGQGPGTKPKSIEPNPSPISPLPSPISPLPSPETDEELQELDESPSLLDEPEIPPACLSDLEMILEAGISDYPGADAMQKTAPDNFRYLYAQEWELLPDNKDRRTAAVAAVEKEIKDRA